MKRKLPTLMMAGVAAAAFGNASLVGELGAGDAAPDRIKIFAMGTHIARDGRGPWTLTDKAHAERVIAASMALAGSTDMMVDYDHQSVFAVTPEVGGQAKAAGWIKSLEADDTGIFARVEWTSPAAEAIGGREYRYVSPVFKFDKTGLITAIVNVALVNRPALALDAVAAHFSPQEDDDSMDREAICAALGLPKDADDAAIMAAINGKVTTMTAVAAALKVDASGDLVAAATQLQAQAVAAGAPDPALYVPKAAFDELRTEVASLQEGTLQAEVDAAVASGRLSPALKDWGLSLIKSDRTAFASFIDKAPVFQGGRVIGGQPGNGDALSEDEIAVCAQLGITHDVFIASRKENQA